MNLTNQHLERAEKKYTKQPFAETYHRTRAFCILLAYVSQTLGAALASYYIFHKIGTPLIPEAFKFKAISAILITLFTLFTLESFKRLFITVSFRKCYKKYILYTPQNMIILICSLALTIVTFSILTSYNGAVLYANNTHNQTDIIKEEYQTRLNQTLNSINAEIKSKKRTITFLEQREQDRKWGLTNNESQTLKLASETVLKLNHEKQEVKKAFRIEIKSALKQAKEEHKKSLWPIIVFSIIIEFIIVGCIGFIEFFDVKIIEETNYKTTNQYEDKYPHLVKELKKTIRSGTKLNIQNLKFRYNVSLSTINRILKHIQ